MAKRISEKVKRPYYITIPKTAEVKYFYGKYDIVKQTKALWSCKGESIVRCSKPFTIKVTMKGKEKTIESKKELK